MNPPNNTASTLCHLCSKNINSVRKVAVGYKNNLENSIDICHWTCFTGTFSNTHDHTYIGVKMYRGGVPSTVQWSNLSDKCKKNAKALMTKIKMYGDLEVHKVHISGMGASSMMLTPNDVAKIYEDNHNTTKKKFADRKKEWLQAEKDLNNVDTT